MKSMKKRYEENYSYLRATYEHGSQVDMQVAITPVAKAARTSFVNRHVELGGWVNESRFMCWYDRMLWLYPNLIFPF